MRPASRRRPARSARVSPIRSASRSPSAICAPASAPTSSTISPMCICGDGCLMEGIGQEAVTLAGHLGLGRLIVLYDNNGISIDGPTSLSTSEDHKKRFLAAGWHVQEVDGLDQEAVTRAIRRARNVADKPSMISCKTIIGYGAPTKAGTAATHGSPLGKDEVAGAREKLGWTAPPFEIPEPIFTAWRKIGSQGQVAAPQVDEAPRRDGRGRPRRVRSRPEGRHPAGGRRGGPRLQAEDGEREALLGDPQVEPGSARGHQPGAARDDRRLGRSHPLEQHQDQDARARRPRPSRPGATCTTASASTRCRRR